MLALYHSSRSFNSQFKLQLDKSDNICCIFAERKRCKLLQTIALNRPQTRGVKSIGELELGCGVDTEFDNRLVLAVDL